MISNKSRKELTIKLVGEISNSVSVKKGWDNKKADPIYMAALFHAEISEFVEEIRNKPDKEIWYGKEVGGVSKPIGPLSELADVIIFITGYCKAMGWDLNKAVVDKITYNMTRPYRHGRP